jgi:hypothetical protein
MRFWFYDGGMKSEEGIVIKRTLENLFSMFRPSPTRTVSAAVRIESARITSSKLKALKKPRYMTKQQPGVIHRLLTKASKMYSELKEQRTPPTAGQMIERMERDLGHRTA